MTKENAAQYLPLVQSLAEGKTIQLKMDSGEWDDLKTVCFMHEPSYYRIKPEPRHLWVNEYYDGTFRAYESKESAVRAGGILQRVAVEYLEVLP